MTVKLHPAGMYEDERGRFIPADESNGDYRVLQRRIAADEVTVDVIPAPTPQAAPPTLDERLTALEARVSGLERR